MKQCSFKHVKYFFYNFFRERNVQEHLKKVYGTLSIAMIAAGVGAYVHLFTGLMRVGILFLGTFDDGLYPFGKAH